MLGKFDWLQARCATFLPAGSGQQRFGPVQSRRAVAEQRGPRRSPAGALSRLPDQMADDGTTSLPDESDGRRRCHPGEREPPWRAEARLGATGVSQVCSALFSLTGGGSSSRGSTDDACSSST